MPPPFPNYFGPTTQPISGHADFEVPYSGVGTPNEITIGITLYYLLEGKDSVVNIPLNLSLRLDTIPNLFHDIGVTAAEVRPENAFQYQSANQARSLLASIIPLAPVTQGNWTGKQTITYSVPGVFGLTLDLIKDRPHKLTYDTKPSITIHSEDYVSTKRTEALTTGLTFFILGFASLDILGQIKGDDASRGQTKNAIKQDTF